MAIIKCDDVIEEPPVITDATGSVTTEPTIVDDEVSLGKTLLAVESGFFLSDTLNPVISKVNTNLLETRPPDVEDTFRADSNRYWTLDENGNMKYMNTNIYGFVDNVNPDSPPPTFMLSPGNGNTWVETLIETTPLGLDCIEVEYTIRANAGDDDVFNADLWEAFVDGTMYPEQSVDPDETFSRPTSLIPTGQTFTDHAFKMNTPFSKKELEMFANISDSVKLHVADVESDYDFFAKAYEEGIARSDVPENALPHLYTEVQRGESETENTIVSTTTLQGDQVEEGYFREWMNKVLSDATEMHNIAEKYENVAILDSTVDETNLLDSETKVVSAFLLLMDYANRENLFPMNVNINVDTNENSNVMDEAESAGMVDDIVRMLIGDGDVRAVDNIAIDQIDKEIAAASYKSCQFTATKRFNDGTSESINPEWTLSTEDYGTIDSNGLFTPLDIETEDESSPPYTIEVTARYESMEASTNLIIQPVIDGGTPDNGNGDDGDDGSTSKGKGSEEDLNVYHGGTSTGKGSGDRGGEDVDGVNVLDLNEEEEL
jgi:hypothetical protein